MTNETTSVHTSSDLFEAMRDVCGQWPLVSVSSDNWNVKPRATIRDMATFETKGVIMGSGTSFDSAVRDAWVSLTQPLEGQCINTNRRNVRYMGPLRGFCPVVKPAPDDEEDSATAKGPDEEMYDAE